MPLPAAPKSCILQTEDVCFGLRVRAVASLDRSELVGAKSQQVPVGFVSQGIHLTQLLGHLIRVSYAVDVASGMGT